MLLTVPLREVYSQAALKDITYYHCFNITVHSVGLKKCILFGVRLSAEIVVGTQSQFTFIQERFNNKKAHILNTHDKVSFILRSWL
jgi:hypothetical protein